MGDGGGDVEHRPIHLHHVTMVVDQLALEGKYLVVESGITVGQGVHPVHEGGVDVPNSIADNDTARGFV